MPEFSVRRYSEIGGLGMKVGRSLSVSGKLAALCAAFLIPTMVLGYAVTAVAWASLTAAELEIRGVESMQLIWPAFETIARGKDVMPDAAKASLERVDGKSALGLDDEIRALTKLSFSLDLMRDADIVLRKMTLRSNLAFDPHPENAFLVRLVADDLVRLVKDVRRMNYGGAKDANSVAFARLDEAIRDLRTSVQPSGDGPAVKKALVEPLKVLNQR
ncbi:MAG TPA: hypothetical protein VJR30_08545, partial [Bradyrhizobium sp.]|nr:hypothetical protein [Bradyrhizobium sp.]